jgi:hypothetical protein
VVFTSPRTDVRVIRFVRRAEARLATIADVTRATRVYCESIGLTPPSYEQVRRLVHVARDARLRRRAAIDLVLDVELQGRPPADLLYLLEDPRSAPARRRHRTL